MIYLLRMSIEKLFGRFNYDIQFNHQRVSILTGPNGFGKSIILKCLEAFSLGNMIFFLDLDFKKIELFFNDRNVSIINEDNSLIINDIKFKKEFIKAIQNFERTNSSRYYYKSNNGSIISNRTMYDEMSLTDYEKYKLIEEYEKFKIINDKIYFEEKYNRDNLSNYDKKIYEKYKNEIDVIREKVGKVYFIKEQRLISDGRSKTEIKYIIEELPEIFKRLIRNTSSDYSIISNELDSTYPNRLFNMENGIKIEDYDEKINNLKEKLKKLERYDLISSNIISDVIFKQENAIALKIYFDDFDKKYNVYESLIEKFDLFIGIVNERLMFKKIKISRDKGIVVVDEDNHKEDTLNLEKLSSGEQQVIVLFYNLIFRTRNNILLLIDEPEISLHIAWQKMFMDDMMKIVDYKGINVIVATHSPQILSNHWEKQIDLGELYKNEFNKI